MRTIKILDINDAELYEMFDGRRKKVAAFGGEIRIKEKSIYVPVLGELKEQVRKFRASFIITEQMECIRDPKLSGLKMYEITGNVSSEREDEHMIIPGVRYEGIDYEKNEIVFEITDNALINKMLGM